MTRVAIMQPQYLPTAGFFDLIRAVDSFIVLDVVQSSPQSRQQRNLVRQPDGRVATLVVPTKRPHLQPLNLLEVDHSKGWQRKHWRTIQACYARSPGWPRLRALLQPVYELHSWKYLADLTSELIYVLARDQGITTRIRRASMLPDAGSDRLQRLVNLCRSVDATTYLSVRGSTYLEGMPELAPGLPIEWFDYARPPGEHLSVIDDLARRAATPDVPTST